MWRTRITRLRKNRMLRKRQLLCGIALAGLTVSTAMAETRLPVSPELKGIDKILGVIGNINLAQVDQKANQSILDILEVKSEVNSSKASSKVATYSKRPHSRRLKKYTN